MEILSAELPACKSGTGENSEKLAGFPESWAENELTPELRYFNQLFALVLAVEHSDEGLGRVLEPFHGIGIGISYTELLASSTHRDSSCENDRR